MTPQDFWSNPETALWWEKEDARYRRTGGNEASQYYLRYAVPARVKTICEVGAGTGRLIRMFKSRTPHAVDINPGLTALVGMKYPFVNTHIGPAHQIDLPTGSMDMVYTFQALQHVPNDLIVPTLREMLRVTNDHLWLIEGYKKDKQQGERTHKANGGSFCYYYDQIFNCESVTVLQPGIKVYKIRKKDNPSFQIRFGEK